LPRGRTRPLRLQVAANYASLIYIEIKRPPELFTFFSHRTIKNVNFFRIFFLLSEGLIFILLHLMPLLLCFECLEKKNFFHAQRFSSFLIWFSFVVFLFQRPRGRKVENQEDGELPWKVKGKREKLK
jgi:hypothetical protein